MKCGSVLSNDKFWTSICMYVCIGIVDIGVNFIQIWTCSIFSLPIYEIVFEDTEDVVFSVIDAKTQPLLPHFCNLCSFLIVGGELFAWTTSENY